MFVRCVWLLGFCCDWFNFFIVIVIVIILVVKVEGLFYYFEFLFVGGGSRVLLVFIEFVVKIVVLC